jgi:hypothetical protein
MHSILSSFGKSIAFALSLAITPCAVSSTVCAAESATPAVVKPDMKKVETHLKQDQTYPATRAELLATCNNLMEFSQGEKAWFAAHLHEGTYKSAAEVLKALRK